MNSRARIVTFMLVLLMIITLNINHVSSASYEWIPLNDTLPVAEIYDIAVDPLNSNNIYTINTRSGVYKSTDGGANWFQVNSGLEGNEIFCILADRKNAKILYVGSYGIYKSEDGGISWIQLDLHVTSRVTSIEIDPNNANVIYAITEEEGIYKSEDSGKTWILINKGFMPEYSLIIPRIKDLIFDPKNPLVVYACSSEGIFKSNNGGMNWEKTNTGLLQKVTIRTKDPGGKEIETEGEVTPFVYSGVINTSNPSNLYIGTSFGVFVTDDTGQNWRKLPGLEGQIVLKIVASEKLSKFIILTEQGLYESSDLCNTWRQIPKIGLFQRVNNFAAKFGEKEEIYLATNKGVYKSEDRGNNFSPCNKNLTYINLLHIYSSSSGDLVFLAAAGDGLYESSNIGNSWSHLENGLENLSVISVCVDSSDSNVIFVGTDNGIFISKDGGATFNSVSNDLVGKVVYSVACANSETIIAGTNSGIYKTKDRGLTWKAADSGIDKEGYFSCTNIAIDPKNASIIYAGTAEKGIFVSEDSCESWISLNENLESPYPPVNSIEIDPGNSSNIYLATEGNGLLKSENGGKNWEKLENIPSPWVKDIAINQADGKNIFIVLYPPLVMESKDGGVTWKDVTSNLSLKDITAIEFVGNIFVAGTKTGVYKLINTYTINASSSSGGSILPYGAVNVKSGESKNFQIIPEASYKIKDIKVDGISVGNMSSYTFVNVNSDHTIYASFEKEVTIQTTIIVLQIGNSTFTVNGATKTLDSPPIIKNSRTLLPIRAVVEAVGGSVSWEASTKKVAISLGSTTIELLIGKSIAKVNGIDTPIDATNSKVVPEIINSRTMLPLRFVAESLGCDVQWDGTIKMITIKYEH